MEQNQTLPFALGVGWKGGVTIDKILVKGGKSCFLSYFDSNNNFNLATDLKGGMNFDFDSPFTCSGIKSSFSPTFIPIGGDEQAHVFQSTKDGIQNIDN